MEREELGMIFTEDTISEFMANRCLDLLIETFKAKKKNLSLAQILDPCVGGGSFYISILKILKMKNLFNKNKFINFINNNITAIDIENKAIQLTIENIEKSDFKNINNKNLICGNFLDLSIEKKYDLIIGNPPYIGEKNNKEIFNITKKTQFGKKYYEKGMDYFYYFIEKSIELLNEDGILSFIVPSYWSRADSASKLRKLIKDNANFIDVVDFGEKKVFEDAPGHHSMIFFMQKKKIINFNYYKIQNKKENIKTIVLDIIIDMNENDINSETDKETGNLQNIYTKSSISNNFCMEYSPYFIFVSNDEEKLFTKIKENTICTLSHVASINQGIVSGADKINNTNIKLLETTNSNTNIGEGIFVLNKKEAEIFKGKCSKLVNFYKNSDIKPYTIKESKYYLLYATENLKKEDKKIIINHLSKYKPILIKRRECLLGTRPYYCLQWPRKENIFNNEKIISPQRALSTCFAYSNEVFYASADIYFITDIKEDPFFLLGYLNSSFIEFYLRNVGKNKGKYLELYQKPLSEIPIIKIDIDSKNKIAKLAKLLTYDIDYKLGTKCLEAKESINEIIWDELNRN